MPLNGLMQRQRLNVSSILDYAARWHPEQEVLSAHPARVHANGACMAVASIECWLSTALQVVSKLPEGPTIITTYADIHRRSQLCALALQALGVR